MGLLPTITIDATSIPPDSRLKSPANLAFFVGNPPQQMQIFTGTVAVHLKSHRSVEPEEVRVILGSTTSQAQTCSKVDLASITNSDSEFIFAVNTNTVEIDSTGLITLVTQIGVQGTDSIFERFSYHVEVLSNPVDTLIAGTIRWSESLGTPSPSALAGQPLFRVDAGVFTTPPGGTPHMQGGGRSGFTHGEPVLAGGIWAVAYQIDNVPLGPSNVVLPVLLPNELTNLPAGATDKSFHFAPPTTIQLTLAAPSAVGVDFEMLLDAGPR